MWSGQVEAMITSPSTGVNSTAWDFALRCDVHETVAWSASQTRTANQLLKRYLDFATAGLEGLVGR